MLGHAPEIPRSLKEKLNPIFQQVTQELSLSECFILSSARQAFINPNIAPNTANWGLHMFAISKNRDSQVEQGMTDMYCVKADYLDVAGFDSSFDKLKVNLLTLIRFYILAY